jgi:hypothetical protein
VENMENLTLNISHDRMNPMFLLWSYDRTTFLGPILGTLVKISNSVDLIDIM